MRLINGQLLFSATDLMNYLGCAHCTFLDLHPPSDAVSDSELDEEAELLKKKGIEHEHRYRDHLVAQGFGMTQITDQSTLEERIAKTTEAILRGDHVIYQATLIRSPWHGYVDFLERVDARSALGNFSYDVTDTKLAQSPKAKYLVQLCVYAYLLELIQGVPPSAIHIVLGTNERRTYRPADFTHYVELARSRFAVYVAHPPSSSRPEPCNHCAQCRWNESCQKEWEVTDHLGLVANIQRSQIRKLNSARINTMHELATMPKKFTVPHIGMDTLSKLRSQAQLQVQKKDKGKNVCEVLPVEAAKGFCRLPHPDAGDVFFDMEGDPHFPEGLEYLFGFSFLDRDKAKFTPYWAHDREQEKVALEQAMDFMVARLKKYPQAYVYHYAHYEPTALKRLAAYHGTREEELDWLLRNQKFVDLFKVVRESIRTSQPGYSLKDLEIFYLSGRESAVKTAGASIVMYEKFCATGDAAILSEIQSYNAEDCRSTQELRSWLLKQRPSRATWFAPHTKELDAEKLAAIGEAQARRAELEERLLACDDPRLKEMRELVSQLLDFHRREQKPQWWKMFDRQERTDDELVDDIECLGGLTQSRTTKPYSEARSTVYTYDFPEQETKLGIGDICHIAATLERAGEIVGLDLKRCEVAIKRGNKSGALPPTFSATPAPPIDSRRLRDALFRFADAEVSGANPHRAARALLMRDLPRIDGVRKGDPVASSKKATVGATINAVANLRNSYLLIQGPPGSGKTYTASHVIVELLRRGKRVGISSNSHKAIHNLLTEVERVAGEKGVSFLGVKKASGQHEESAFNGKFIVNVTSTKDVTAKFQLVAGTVYMFAELNDPLDFLFVDEAGQVSLANAVIMAMMTRSLVLVGDQMQLAQPIQGVHPGKSGLSVLEFALEDQATIPPGRGIFLETTYRMHDDVCRFISEAVYDGRLKPEAANRNQVLVLKRAADGNLRSSGISFLEMNHQGCSQRSEQEGEVIKALYLDLLAQRYRDREGFLHPITPANIMIVTPYNMQVNYLASILPPGARVGTVDKLQGQEAEVVLISMVTSSGDDMPRGIEFLYSKNRLNVAISRARSLACIVASSRLLEIQCSTVEQLELVNTLCWAYRYAGISMQT